MDKPYDNSLHIELIHKAEE